MGSCRKIGAAVFAIIILLAIGIYYYINKKTLSPIVEIRTGKLQGIVSYTRNENEIHEYLKVPYAKQPIGKLRFEPPQPAESWEGVYDATESPPTCIQLGIFTQNPQGSEECLYVNVYTPAERKGPLPVMVWFHGGSFVLGDSLPYRPAYLLDEDIILVTTQYRLASFGFINTGDDVARGNMGLKDQTMALKWVQENIEYFGGDPKNVAITGESAGGASVGYHLLSPLSKGLFTSAIMESGSPLAPWAMYRGNPVKQAKRFAAKFSCEDNRSSKEMIDCLREIDAKTLVAGHKDMMLPLREPISIFVPTVESVQDEWTFLGEEPLQILTSGKVNRVPLIIGTNAAEGLLSSSIVTANKTKLKQANEEWDLFSSRLLYLDMNQTQSEELHKIRKFYFGNATDIGSINYLLNYTNLFSDRLFYVSIHQFAKLYSDISSPVKMYLYKYSAVFNLGNMMAATEGKWFPVYINVAWDLLKRYIFLKLGYPLPHLMNSPCHGDELQLLFNWRISPYLTEGQEDYEMSKQMVKAWTDFIKNESPLNFNDVPWLNIDTTNSSLPLQYLNINSNSTMGPEPFTDRIRFWESLQVK